jgi:hypothetical protein
MSQCPDCHADGRTCAVRETPDGKLACECGRHQWPNAGVYAEWLRRRNLTQVKAVHNWTQSL